MSKHSISCAVVGDRMISVYVISKGIYESIVVKTNSKKIIKINNLYLSDSKDELIEKLKVFHKPGTLISFFDKDFFKDLYKFQGMDEGKDLLAIIVENHITKVDIIYEGKIKTLKMSEFVVVK